MALCIGEVVSPIQQVIIVKEFLRKLFAPILNPLESGEHDYAYRPSYRKILLAVAMLFFVLSGASLAMTLSSGLYGGLIPGIFFGLAGLVCLVVAGLGSDKAVARIWKNR